MCTRKCPVDIQVHTMEKVNTAECISCGICVEVCPEPQVMIASRFAKIRIKPIVFLLLSVGLFFGTIFILDRAGVYKVSIPTQQEIIENKNYLSIGDLRGSMTIEAGAFYTGKDLDDFYRIMEIPGSVPPDTLLKYVQAYVPGYDFHAMKAKKALE